MPEIAVLWGADHTRLGDIATGEVTRAGVALSRGRLAKDYQWVDPNEDAVLAAAEGARVLLAVADGHHGFDAARAAMLAVVEGTEALLDPHRQPAAVLVGVLEAARAAVAAALFEREDERSRSRTALSLALIDGNEVSVASHGDTSVLRVGGRGVHSLAAPTPFLGPRTPLPEVVRATLRDGDHVVVASDGFTDFTGRASAQALARATALGTALEAARRLVLDAFAGGAGDNVAVGVLLRDPSVGES